MKKSIFILALVALAIVNVYGEEKEKSTVSTSTECSATLISVNGKVVDKETGEALTGVLVQIDGTSLSTYSDFDGTFTFTNLKAGSYTASVSFISYEKSKVTINALDQNNLKVELSPATIK